jgi:hypothetical protein
MTFGLKNAGATYQKAIQKCLKTQIGKNVEAYVDDVVVKTTEEDKLIIDLTETFANLREFQWKLNPTKCVFGVPSGLLLGFMVGHRGIEANPAKIDAIRKMAKPSNKKDVMKLTGMMAIPKSSLSKSTRSGTASRIRWMLNALRFVNSKATSRGSNSSTSHATTTSPPMCFLN